MAVAELADRFQVSWLVSICEREMVKWVEIPLIDRLLFADLHGLKELKVAYCLLYFKIGKTKKECPST